MNRSMLMLAMLAALSLGACEKPTVINVPPPSAGVPGPAGPAGATGDQGRQGNQGNQGNQGTEGATGSQGAQGYDGNKGATGKAGEGTTVIVMPPAASAPTN